MNFGRARSRTPLWTSCDGVEAFRVLSAYVAFPGSKLPFDAIERAGPDGDHGRVVKTIVASLDFGLTEPEALSFWQDMGSGVRVAGANMLESGALIPRSAFQPKLYLCNRPDGP